MTEPNNNKDQQPQLEPQDKLIFVAILSKDNQFKVELKTNNLMALSYAHKIVGLQIDDMILKMHYEKPKIEKVTPAGLDSLGKFLKFK